MAAQVFSAANNLCSSNKWRWTNYWFACYTLAVAAISVMVHELVPTIF